MEQELLPLLLTEQEGVGFVQLPVWGQVRMSERRKRLSFGSVTAARRPEQLLVDEQFFEVLAQRLLLQGQVDPGSSLSHL